MTRTLALVLATIIPMTALAGDPATPEVHGVFRPAGDSELESFLWSARIIVVFADAPADPRFQQQIDLLMEDEQRLVDRDVLVLTDTDPDARLPIRLKLRPRGFQMVLVDKDGVVKLRKPFPWSVREITRSIDKTPMRQREVVERRKGN
jgi:Domain of unknown function (DUF4174)